MDKIEKIITKVKKMSKYNPLSKIYVDYGLRELEMSDLNMERRLKFKEELEQFIKTPESVDQFAIACVRRFFSKESRPYLTIPYFCYLQERLNMMNFYKDSGDSDLEVKRYVYEESASGLVEALQNNSEDAWWDLEWLTEYLIIAKKMDLLNFETDEYKDIILAVKQKALEIERTAFVTYNENLMDAFGKPIIGPDKIKSQKLEILKAYLAGDEISKFIKTLNSEEIKTENYEEQLELREYIEKLQEPIDLYYYLSLYKDNPKWIYAFPEELVEKLRKLISDIFKQPDSDSLAAGLSEYLIIKDLCENVQPNARRIVKECYPLLIDESEVEEKILLLTATIEKERGTNGEK